MIGVTMRKALIGVSGTEVLEGARGGDKVGVGEFAAERRGDRGNDMIGKARRRGDGLRREPEQRGN